jgi:outer membrane lipopolysaccharide assembly protein LptE/RlpB
MFPGCDGRRAVVLAAAVALLSACSGWYLRGKGENRLAVDRVMVQSQAGSYVTSWFLNTLTNSGIKVVKNRKDAEIVIELKGEQYDRRVLSVDEKTGKVREMEVGLAVEIAVRAPDGSLVLAPEKVTWTQDYVFDEASLLGTEEVETTIRYALARDAARALMIRLETIDLSAAHRAG